MALTEANIAGVRNQLEQATTSFAAPGFGRNSVDHLREAVRLLEGIRLAAIKDPPAAALAPALRELQACAARLGQLFDSAAAFYRGWFQVSPAPAEDYTADGLWAAPQRFMAGGGLSLEA